MPIYFRIVDDSQKDNINNTNNGDEDAAASPHPPAQQQGDTPNHAKKKHAMSRSSSGEKLSGQAVVDEKPRELNDDDINACPSPRAHASSSSSSQAPMNIILQQPSKMLTRNGNEHKLIALVQTSRNSSGTAADAGSDGNKDKTVSAASPKALAAATMIMEAPKDVLRCRHTYYSLRHQTAIHSPRGGADDSAQASEDPDAATPSSSLPPISYSLSDFTSASYHVNGEYCAPADACFGDDVPTSQVSGHVADAAIPYAVKRNNTTFLCCGVAGAPTEETFMAVVRDTVSRMKKNLESTLHNDAEDAQAAAAMTATSSSTARLTGTFGASTLAGSTIAFDEEEDDAMMDNIGASPAKGRRSVPRLSLAESALRQSRKKSIFSPDRSSSRGAPSPLASQQHRFLYLNSKTPQFIVPKQTSERLFPRRPDSARTPAKTARVNLSMNTFSSSPPFGGRSELLEQTLKGSMSARTPGRQRRSSFDVLKDVSPTTVLGRAAVAERDPQPRGRCKKDYDLAAYFNGTSTHCFLPTLTNLGYVVNCMRVDLLIKTKCNPSDGERTLLYIGDTSTTEAGQVMHISVHANPEHEEVKRAVHQVNVLIRDSMYQSLECALRCDARLFDDSWHLLTVSWSLGTNRVQVSVDGKNDDRVKTITAEAPRTFTPWQDQVVMLGARPAPDHDGSCVSHFLGAIGEVRIMALEPTRVELFHASLDGPTRSDSAASPRSVSPPAADGSGSRAITPVVGPITYRDVAWEVSKFDSGNFYHHLEGTSAVSVGNLKSFGEALSEWALELSFRTHLSHTPMCLFGVTDSQRKHQEVCVVLHAEYVSEPNAGRRYIYKENVLTLILVDSDGRTLSASYKAPMDTSFADGNWWVLQWRVIDSANNNMELKVNFEQVDLYYVDRRCPAVFLPFKSWVCIGAHNVRDAHIVTPFRGFVGRVLLTVHETEYAKWQLDEGPDAVVAFDSTGNRFHGFYRNLVDARGPDDPNTTGVPENDRFRIAKPNATSSVFTRLWAPCPAIPEVTTEEFDALLKTMQCVRYDNNKVYIAFTHVALTQAADGTTRETAFDLVKSAGFALTPDHTALPQDVFHRIRDYDKLVQAIDAGTKRLCRRPPGHTFVLLRLGDSTTAFVNLAGPVLSPISSYDPLTSRWVGAVTNHGANNKRNAHINSCVSVVERMLFYVGMLPRQFKKAVHVHPDVYRSVHGQSVVPVVLYSQLTHFTNNSNVQLMYVLRKYPFLDEVHSCLVPLQRILRQTMSHAIIVVQRNVRRMLAKRRYIYLCRLRDEEEEREKRIIVLRKNYPQVAACEARRSVLVSVLPSDDSALPRAPDMMRLREKISGVCEGQFAVVMEPTTEWSTSDLATYVAEVHAVEEMSVVYINGFGARMSFRRPPIPSLGRAVLLHAERMARLDLEIVDIALRTKFLKDVADGARAIAAALAAKKTRGRRPAPPPPRSTRRGGNKGGRGAGTHGAGADADAGLGGTSSSLSVEEQSKRMDIEAWEASAIQELASLHVHAVTENSTLSDLMTDTQVHGLLWASDTPLRCPTPFNCINVDALADDLLGGAPEIGQQRLLIVDAVSAGDHIDVDCSGGFGFIGCSNGQRVYFPYRAGQVATLTDAVHKALRGNAQPDVRPRKMADADYKMISAPQFLEYVVRKMTQWGVPPNAPLPMATFVADIIVSPKVLLTPSERAQKRVLEGARRTMHLSLLVSHTWDVTAGDYITNMTEELRFLMTNSSVDAQKATLRELVYAVPRDELAAAISEVRSVVGPEDAYLLKIVDDTILHKSLSRVFVPRAQEVGLVAVPTDGTPAPLPPELEDDVRWLRVQCRAENTADVVATLNLLRTRTVTESYGCRVLGRLGVAQCVEAVVKCPGTVARAVEAKWLRGTLRSRTLFEKVEDLYITH
eukprot:PhM_4_TR5471/c0_g1_i1/m.17963